MNGTVKGRVALFLRIKPSPYGTGWSTPRNLFAPCATGQGFHLILNTTVYQGSVKDLKLKELFVAIDMILSVFDDERNPDNVLSAIQAQPSLFCVLFITTAAGNLQHLRAKVLEMQ